MSQVAWSYSRLSAFETCPRRYYLTTVAKKVSEPQTAATMEGNAVHKALADYLSIGTPLPQKWASYTPYAKRIRDTPGKRLVEEKFALTADFKPTTFFAKNVWMRAIIDAGVVGEKSAAIFDWKTGKRKVDQSQLQLFALTTFTIFPHVERVQTGFVWLQDKLVDSETYQREQVPDMWRGFLVRVERMERAHEKNQFPPNPSGLCRRWCHVGKALCEHCGE